MRPFASDQMKTMRVLHVIPSISPKRGGPSTALPMLVRASIAAGVEVTVATTDDDGPTERLDVPLQREVREGDNAATHIYFPRQSTFYTISWPLRDWLRSHVGDFDVVHIHALFSFPSVVAARAAQRAGVPYVIRPLGVLNRWGLAHRRPILKRGSLRLVEVPLIRRAAAMHYTSGRERDEAHWVDPVVADTASAIIPLPVEIFPENDRASAGPFYGRFPEAVDRQVVLFLSRIDRKKGIELLLEAFASVLVEFPGALLVLAGNGEEGYIAELRGKAEGFGIASHVLWAGFLSGADKRGAFVAATLFVLPSYSENFGIAAAEALAAGVPVLLSDQVAVADDVREHGAGVVVSCEANSIADGLRQLLANPTLRSTFSTKGKALVAERYSMLAIGGQLKSLYASVVNQSSNS